MLMEAAGGSGGRGRGREANGQGMPSGDAWLLGAAVIAIVLAIAGCSLVHPAPPSAPAGPEGPPVPSMTAEPTAAPTPTPTPTPQPTARPRPTPRPSPTPWPTILPEEHTALRESALSKINGCTEPNVTACGGGLNAQEVAMAAEEVIAYCRELAGETPSSDCIWHVIPQMADYRPELIGEICNYEDKNVQDSCTSPFYWSLHHLTEQDPKRAIAIVQQLGLTDYTITLNSLLQLNMTDEAINLCNQRPAVDGKLSCMASVAAHAMDTNITAAIDTCNRIEIDGDDDYIRYNVDWCLSRTIERGAQNINESATFKDLTRWHENS